MPKLQWVAFSASRVLPHIRDRPPQFARDVGDGICIQVMQGNDTDSFGATAGSLLGAWFGPGHLESRWTDPFQDRIQLALATTWVTSISELMARMAALPERVRRGPDPATPGMG